MGGADLTERERNAVALVARAWPDKAIAHELDCAESTVKTYLHGARRKAGVRNRVGLALWFLGIDPATGERTRNA